MDKSKLVYIASPYAGDFQLNSLSKCSENHCKTSLFFRIMWI